MEPSRRSARSFLEGFMDESSKEEGDQVSMGSEDDEPSKFKSPEDYLNEGPSPTTIQEVKDHLIETSQAKRTVSTPYA